MTEYRYIKNPSEMKNKIIAGFALLVFVITVSSCATSRKYGCPTVSVEAKKYRA